MSKLKKSELPHRFISLNEQHEFLVIFLGLTFIQNGWKSIIAFHAQKRKTAKTTKTCGSPSNEEKSDRLTAWLCPVRQSRHLILNLQNSPNNFIKWTRPGPTKIPNHLFCWLGQFNIYVHVTHSLNHQNPFVFEPLVIQVNLPSSATYRAGFARQGAKEKQLLKDNNAFNVSSFVLRAMMSGQYWPEGDEVYHAELTVPILLVHGMHDKFVPVEEDQRMAEVSQESHRESDPQKDSAVIVCHYNHRKRALW